MPTAVPAWRWAGSMWTRASRARIQPARSPPAAICCTLGPPAPTSGISSLASSSLVRRPPGFPRRRVAGRPRACSNRERMRVLLVEEDARRCAQIRRRLASWRPHARLTVHSPLSQGELAPEFLAQGYDAVLLAEQWPGGGGLEWARELTGRTGFAPIVLLRDGATIATSETEALGAWTLKSDELEGEEFTRVLTAAEQRQAYARAVWRTSPAGRDAQRFGDAFIRGYRRIRRLAAGPLTDLYVGESERAGMLVALKVARDRQEEGGPIDIFKRFLQEYEIAQRIGGPGAVQLFDLGVSDEHAWLVMEYFPL